MRVHITVTDEKGNDYDGTAELTKVGAKKTSPKAKKIQKTTKLRTIEGPTNAIQELYSKQYFKDEKTRQDVIQKLKDMGYNFVPNRVSKALIRAEYLIPKGKKGSYTFIQKYPPGRSY